MGQTVNSTLTTILISLISGSAPSIVLWLLTRRKYEAEVGKLKAETEKLESDAAALLTEAASGLVGDLRSEVDALKEDKRGLEKRVSQLEELGGRQSATIANLKIALSRAEGKIYQLECENRTLRETNHRLAQHLADMTGGDTGPLDILGEEPCEGEDES